MDIDLYSVSATGRVTLGDLLAGSQFVTASKDEATGNVTLVPVRINPAHARPAADTDQPDANEPGDLDHPF